MRCQSNQSRTWRVDGSRVRSCRVRRHSTGELLAGETIHLQLSSKASNLQPDIFLPEGILVGRGVSQVQANQLVKCPVQVEVLHARRFLRGQREAPQMPFQFGELRQVRQRLSSGMRAKVPRKPVAVLSDTRSRRGLFANKRGRGVCHEFRTDQPHGGGEPFDQRASQTRHVVPLVNGESMSGIGPTQQYGRYGRAVTVDERVTNACLDVSQPEHGDPLSRPLGYDRRWLPLPTEPLRPADRCPIPRSWAAGRSGGW